MQQVTSTTPNLAAELKRRQQYRNLVNTKIAQRLYKTSQLPGFTGNLQTGRRIGRSATRNDGVPLPSWARCFVDGETLAQLDVDAAEDDEDEERVEGIESERDVNVYVDFLDGLGTREQVDRQGL